MNSNRQALEGVLTARPTAIQQLKDGTGLQRLGLGSGRDGILYVPEIAKTSACPLIMLLHGSGADSHDIIGTLQSPAEQNGCVLLVPDSREYTWDVLIGGFGPDVRFLDRALAHAFTRCRVDLSRVAIAGFSDGASYALTLGVTNGDFFSHIIAFSPGFLVPPRMEDSPRIFISHGVRDEVLSIDRCSRRIVPKLKEWSYDVTYREFPDEHIIPEAIIGEAMQWFLQSPRAIAR